MSSTLHSVFDISRMEPNHAYTILGRRSPTPPPVDFEDRDWFVERIVTSWIRKGQVQYLVSWKGYGPDDNTGKPYENWKNGAEETVCKYHLDYPGKLQALEVLV